MSSGRLESVAFYVFLVTLILVPLSFVPSPYIGLDLVKTILIALGTLIPAICLGMGLHRERKLTLPPKVISVLIALIILSLVFSAFLSGNVARSFFGQGFENVTAGFIVLLFIALGVSFALVRRRTERAGLFYAAFTGAFLILALFHTLRLLIGPQFAQLPFFTSLTSSFFGTWSSFGVFSLLVSLTSFLALRYLPLSGGMKAVYWVATIGGICGGLVVHVPWTLGVFGITLIVYCFEQYFLHRAMHGSVFQKIPWIPSVLAVIFIIATVWGMSTLNNVTNTIRAEYTEFALPWQMTLDIASQSLKVSPLFGVGPNFFSQAFLTYKPPIINTSNLWGIEFNSGVGTIPTSFVTQGLIGGLLWILFLIIIGCLIFRTLRHHSDNPYIRFILASSSLASAFLWLVLIGYNPSHVVLFVTFVMTGIWLGTAVSLGIFHPYTFHSSAESRAHRILPILGWVFVVLCLAGGIVYVKKTVAFIYFASGVKHLTQEGNLMLADDRFITATRIDPSDIYWRARAEAGLTLVAKLADAALTSPSASSTEIGNSIASTLNQGMAFATQAVTLDPQNYYNYVSVARVSEVAMRFKVPSAYESTIQAYTNAIGLNPYNPSLYLNLARIEASQGKYDKALQAIGGALQLKNNYSEAAFMASQVAAAQGKIADAITAARVTTQLSPESPVAWFQLGVLLYTSKDYSGAVQALEQAVKAQSDYANAKYFLGLSYARLNKSAEATSQFEDLATTNPDNQEIKLILNNLRAGRSPFADAIPPVTPTPEKRSALPLKDPAPSVSAKPKPKIR
jgi:tetratricopeptide (TPR) repeat protein